MAFRTDSNLSQQLVPNAGRARRPSSTPSVESVEGALCPSRLNFSRSSSPPADGPRQRSRTPSIDGPRLSFSQLSRGELPVVVIPEQRERRRILFAAYGVLFARYVVSAQWVHSMDCVLLARHSTATLLSLTLTPTPHAPCTLHPAPHTL